MVKLYLNEDVKFVHDLFFAKQELNVLGANVNLNDSTEYFLLKNADENLLCKINQYSSYVNKIDDKTTIHSKIVDNNYVFKDYFQQLYHSQFPYPINRSMARSFVNILNLKKGNTVFIPFANTGDIAVSLQYLGINTYNSEINEVDSILCFLKTNLIKNIDIFKEYSDQINVDGFGLHPNLDIFTLSEKISRFIKDEQLLSCFKFILWRLEEKKDNKSLKERFVSFVETITADVNKFKKLISTFDLNVGETNITNESSLAYIFDLKTIDSAIICFPVIQKENVKYINYQTLPYLFRKKVDKKSYIDLHFGIYQDLNDLNNVILDYLEDVRYFMQDVIERIKVKSKFISIIPIPSLATNKEQEIHLINMSKKILKENKCNVKNEFVIYNILDRRVKFYKMFVAEKN